MIIITLILMAISLIVFMFMNRQKEAIWLTGLYIGFALVNIGLMFYYSKMGGLNYGEQILFFLTTSIQRKIQYAVITLDNIARFLSIGRYVFIFFLLMFSLDLVGALKSRFWLIILASIFPLTCIILIDPVFFSAQGYNIRITVDLLGQLTTITYLTVSIILLIKEYLSHNIRWVKKQLRYIILFVLNIITYFVFFSGINPVGIFFSESFHNYNFGFNVNNLRFSLNMWFVVILLFSFFLVIGLVALFQYAKVNIEESRDEVYLKHQLDTANMGTRVFIHGIKNQLFAEKILLNQIKNTLNNEQFDKEILSKNINEILNINNNMSTRIDALYKVFKHNSMTLVPCSLMQLVEQGLNKASKRMECIECEIICKQDVIVLADIDYLSEALYNILINAVDAIKQSTRADCGKIVITIKNDHHWCAIRIDDNGTGIEKSKHKHIFEPFYTDKNTNNSWGLGLSYVKQIIKYHFGKMHVESELDKSTSFIIAFPKYYTKKSFNIIK